jgi:hypothetical protein
MDLSAVVSPSPRKGHTWRSLKTLGRMKYCPVDPDLKLVEDLLNRDSDPYMYRCISSPLFPSEILCTHQTLNLFIDIKALGFATIFFSGKFSILISINQSKNTYKPSR